MLQRLTTAFNKLFFCYRVAADVQTFFRLIINTKKYAITKDKKSNDRPVYYRLILNNIQKNVWLRTYAGDIDIFYEIFWRTAYMHADMPWQQIQTIADLGANAGMSALYLSLRCKEATIYAVEPDEDNFELLTTNLANEILTTKLIPVRAAILPNDGIAFIQKTEKAYNTTITRNFLSGTSVRTISMHTLMKEMLIKEIDLLKIDIEGWEDQIFSGDTGWLDNVKNIVMECHSDDIKSFCRTVLISKGFVILSDKEDFPALLWATRNAH